ncbi:MAG: CoA-binding protein [Syntrophobacteraceae bacterium]|nr:CoA-binding protein [Syntrophobacteraceae bacterium]
MSLEYKSQDSTAGEPDVKALLRGAKTIAVVGISPKEDSASNQVAKYLIEAGFAVIGVNPSRSEILGVKCYPDLKSIPEHVDVVDIFRRVDAIPAIVDEAIQIGAGAVWMQLGLEHEESAQKARQAGLCVVMNKCTKIEHSRYFGRPTL